MRVRDIRPDTMRRRGGATCLEIARTVQRYLDGKLDEPARVRVAGHHAVCRRCGLDEQAYRDIKDGRIQGVSATKA